jgi:Methyltransferase domain
MSLGSMVRRNVEPQTWRRLRRVAWPLVHRHRLRFAMSYIRPLVDMAETWARSDSEDSNFLYALTPLNHLNLTHTLSDVFSVPVADVRALMEEIETDRAFDDHVRAGLLQLLPGVSSFSIGRRLGWYVVARLTKPKLVVETGVDYGLGSCVLCAALLRNAAEGSPGRYLGLDIRNDAGQLLTPPYAKVGQIMYGDALKSLSAIGDPIDLFINDSDHSFDYEAREYETIKNRMSPGAVILGDNSHCSPSLARFSEDNGRRFLFFKEEPAQHWYPGAGIGFSYPR